MLASIDLGLQFLTVKTCCFKKEELSESAAVDSCRFYYHKTSQDVRLLMW